jgi:hypothetical protein
MCPRNRENFVDKFLKSCVKSAPLASIADLNPEPHQRPADSDSLSCLGPVMWPVLWQVLWRSELRGPARAGGRMYQLLGVVTCVACGVAGTVEERIARPCPCWRAYVPIVGRSNMCGLWCGRYCGGASCAALPVLEGVCTNCWVYVPVVGCSNMCGLWCGRYCGGASCAALPMLEGVCTNCWA